MEGCPTQTGKNKEGVSIYMSDEDRQSLIIFSNTYMLVNVTTVTNLLLVRIALQRICLFSTILYPIEAQYFIFQSTYFLNYLLVGIYHQYLNYDAQEFIL